MERIRQCARIVLWRGLGFSTLGIGTLMVGLSWDPVLCLASGAILTAVVGLVLICKAINAPTTNYRDTEVWLLLDGRHNLEESRAQEVIGSLLGSMYRRCAECALAIATAQWLLSVVARLA